MAKVVFVGVEPMTQQHIWMPLKNEFQRNGWETVFCKTGKTSGDIGFYCEDSSLPGKQDFTVITINGLDQDHVVRPDYTNWFSKENWGLFDLGVVPGPRWLNGWVARRYSLKNTPRLGVIPVGWFKGDDAVNKNSRSFKNKKIKTVLYAPQTEQDGKQKTVVEAAVAAGLFLKIKHWEDTPYIDLFPNLLTNSYMQNLAAENKFAKKFKNIKIYPVSKNFMETLSDVDLLITDQSSVLYEASMLNIPTLTCIDWKHACGDCRGPQPSPDITISVHSKELTETLKNIDIDYADLLKKTKLIRDMNFVHLGGSSKVAFSSIIDIHQRVRQKSNMNALYVTTMKFIIIFRLGLRAKRRAAKIFISSLLNRIVFIFK
ncbi:hypothetical protein [uncultured Planktomarina sp.]|jgi:hypothetical protein|uniref:hypothetical protein n=1 Tax=uncultured Planktomarina sp. TaxID=1538529 RepID=UPI0032616230